MPKQLSHSEDSPSGILQKDLRLRLGEAIDDLLASGGTVVSNAINRLRACIDGRAERVHGERKLERMLAHVLFQLRDGVTLFEACGCELDSWMNASLTIERVAESDEGVRKLFVKLSVASSAPDRSAFYQYTEGPSLIVYWTPIVIEPLPQDNAQTHYGPVLDVPALPEFFGNRQLISDGIRVRRSEVPQAEQASMRVHWQSDLRAIRENFETVIRQRRLPARLDRGSHPYRPPYLHILPRLVNAPPGITVLQHIERQLSQVKDMGFGGVLIGVVDPQSTSLFYGEGRDGRLYPYPNNHGYWSSGECGIDPLLGNANDYRRLADRCAALSIGFMQDSVYGTLGYPYQIAPPGDSRLAAPTRCVILGDEEADICDSHHFLHEICIDSEDSLHEGVSADHYAAVLLQAHLGSPFALPKPNLFRPEVRQAVLQRSIWQNRQAQVSSFRVDMAKHVGIAPLRSIIENLRTQSARSTDSLRSFSLVLEYWSVRYRDLQFASTILGDQKRKVYLYDFPLAHALQEMHVKRHGYADTVNALLTARAEWSIALEQMVPIFIDHDFNFRPIYNGSPASSALVVVGYAMALMLSANGPQVYFGYANPKAGVADLDHYFSYSEQNARKAVDRLFDPSDPNSPAASIASLFRRFEEHGVLSAWDGSPITCHGDADNMTLVRRCHRPADGTLQEIHAHFKRAALPSACTSDSDVIFSYGYGPSVVVSTKIVA